MRKGVRLMIISPTAYKLFRNVVKQVTAALRGHRELQGPVGIREHLSDAVVAPELPPFVRRIVFPDAAMSQRWYPSGAHILRRWMIEAVHVSEDLLDLRTGFERIHHGVERAAVDEDRPAGSKLDEADVAGGEQQALAGGNARE